MCRGLPTKVVGGLVCCGSRAVAGPSVGKAARSMFLDGLVRTEAAGEVVSGTVTAGLSAGGGRGDSVTAWRETASVERVKYE